MTDYYLTADELAQLSEDEQEAYLAALEAEAEEWALEPMQEKAHQLALRCEEVLAGGAAGGGKSILILYHAYQLSQQYPKHRSLILRSSFPELRRSLILESLNFFDQKVCKYKAAAKEWHFTNESVIEFGFCVGGSTPILMGDGSYKPMDQIRVGEEVGTLAGPRRVVRHFRVGVKPAVKMTLPSGPSVVASRSHAVLSAEGLWTPPSDLAGMPIPCRGAFSCPAPTAGYGPSVLLPRGGTHQDHGRNPSAVGVRDRRDAPPVACAACQAGGGTCRRTQTASTQESQRLPPGFGLVGLHGPAARSAGYESARCSPWRALGHAQIGPSSVPDCPGGCSLGCGPRGARTRRQSTADQAHTPSPAGVGALDLTLMRSGDLASIRSHTPPERASWLHPYTMEVRQDSEVVLPDLVHIAPAGERDLWDMTVEDANHYVSRGGIVHKNCETEEDVRNYLSAQYEFMAIDEATDFSGLQIAMLRSRLRTKGRMRRLGVKPHLLLCSNPGGPGHTYLKDRFVDPTNKGRNVVEIPNNPDDSRSGSRTVAFVPFGVEDNRHIDPEYVSNLHAIPDPVRRAQYLHGDWDIAEGQFFAEFNKGIHVVEAFNPPESWPRWRSLDWGWSAPTGVLWCAQSEDHQIHVYREFYETEIPPERQAELINAMSKHPDGSPERIDYTIADPSIWRATGAGESIATQYLRGGLHGLRKANNARVDGWARVHEVLDTRGGEKAPILQIHDVCRNLIREIPGVFRSPTNPEDIDTRGNPADHLLDSLRYSVASRHRGPVAAKQQDRPGMQGRVDRMLRRMDRAKKQSVAAFLAEH